MNLVAFQNAKCVTNVACDAILTGKTWTADVDHLCCDFVRPIGPAKDRVRIRSTFALSVFHKMTNLRILFAKNVFF